MATNYSIALADYHAMAEAAAKKYGPKAKTVMQDGKVTTTLDGKVVTTEIVKARVEDVFGMLPGRPRSDEMARFPFSLKVRAIPTATATAAATSATRCGHALRSRRRSCSTSTISNGRTCGAGRTTRPTPARHSPMPRRGSTRPTCVSCAGGAASGKTMLIGALAADGGDFVRDASRPICRALTARWLAGPERSVQDTAIDYAACLLVHDPDRGNRGARETVVEHIYEVRPDRSLALID